MRTKKSLLSNQKLIDAAIIKIKPPVLTNKNDAQLYRSKYLWLQKSYNAATKNKSLKLVDYFNLIEKLLEDLLQHDPSNTINIEQHTRLDILNYLSTLLNKAITIIRPDKLQQENFETINDYHEKIETALKVHFHPEFSLPKILDLSGISKEYKNAYENEYGQGFSGFFKLPIKRFFQQNTRTEELKFLSDIGIYCNQNPSLPEAQKNLLKLSATNLVSMKIDTETFGKGSILGKILRNRINESGLPNDSNEMMKQFIEECKTNKIRVPKHLKELYLSIHDVTQLEQSLDI